MIIQQRPNFPSVFHPSIYPHGVNPAYVQRLLQLIPRLDHLGVPRAQLANQKLPHLYPARIGYHTMKAQENPAWAHHP